MSDYRPRGQNIVVGVDVASYATGGAGTEASPWTGWDTAITWSEFTRYRFRSGYYSYATSPNFLQSGIELVGEPGTYLVHTGTGNGFVMDAGASSVWIQNVRVENICVLGKVRDITGLINYTNGSATITGNGTAFTTELAVGYAITVNGGASTAQSYIVTAIGSDTSLTVDRAAVGTATFAAATYTRTQHGFYLRGIRNGAFDRLSCKDVAQAALWTEACVTNSLRLFRTTYHEPEMGAQFLCRPQYGIVTTASAARPGDWSTTWHIEEPVIEGTQTYGIWFKSNSYGNTVINGTSEANLGIGMQIDGPSNTIIGIDLEQNTGNDCVVNSNRNAFLNLYSDGTTIVTGSVGSNSFFGGKLQNFTIQSGSYLNRMVGISVAGTYTDSGNATLYLPVSGTDLRSRVGINRRLTTEASGATVGADCKITERIKVGVSTTHTMSAPSNPTDGDVLEYVFNNNSGSSQTLTWNSIFASTTEHALPTSIATGKAVYVQVEYSSFWTKWHCVNVSTLP